MTDLNKNNRTQMPLYFDDFLTRDFHQAKKKAMPFSISVFPSSNIFETDTEFVLELIVPGIDPNAIEVVVSDNAIEVRHEAANPMFFSGKRKIWAQEHMDKSFRRRYELDPQIMDFNSVDAVFENGILRIFILKNKNFSGKMIPAYSFSNN